MTKGNKEKIELRCQGCNRKLGDVDGNANIVCPRCGGLNKLNIVTKQIKFIPKSMRLRTESSGLSFR